MYRLKWLLWMAALSILSGCFGVGRATPPVVRYVIESPRIAPSISLLSPVCVRVDGFHAAAGYRDVEMVIKPRSFVREGYAHARWRMAPADMLTYLVVRDLRDAGMFRAVLSPNEGGEARFVIEALVEECHQEDAADDKSFASMVVAVTVSDLRAEKEEERIPFQRRYDVKEPLKVRGPDGLAQAMSTAAARFSEALRGDLARLSGR